jgi:hypothetical protein
MPLQPSDLSIPSHQDDFFNGERCERVKIKVLDDIADLFSCGTAMFYDIISADFNPAIDDRKQSGDCLKKRCFSRTVRPAITTNSPGFYPQGDVFITGRSAPSYVVRTFSR